MFDINNEVKRLPAMPKSRLTEREIIILRYIALHILIIQIDDKRSYTVKELKKMLEKINVQLKHRS